MRRHRTGLSYFSVGLIALIVSMVAIYFGFTKAVPFRDHFEVRAVFKTGNNLRPNSPVRIAGVAVGKVTKVEHTAPGDTSVTATLRIDRKGRPIHKDAKVAIRPRIFLEGNFFVDLQPGSPSAPTLGDGDVIPINQTSAPVQLDQILTALQSNTREDLKLLLREYSASLEGAGARGFRRSLKHWKPAYRDSAIVADATLGMLEHDLSEYARHATRVADALDRSPEQLKSLITDFNTTARAFAVEESNLRAAVRELPRTLEAAHPALGALNDSFPSVRALARELRPAVRSSEPAIDASTPLVRELRGLVSRPELRGLVRDLRGTVPSLARLSTRTVPLYEQVRLASSCTNEVILPWSRSKVVDPAFPTQGPVYEQAPKPWTGLSGESRSGDANGQWFRVLASGGTNLVQFKPGTFATTAIPIEGSNPPQPTTRPPLRSDVACETQQPPNLQSKPGPPPPQRRVDTSRPEYRQRVAKSQAAAVKWLRRQLELEGLHETFDVAETPVTKSLVDRLAAQQRAKQAARRARLLREAGR